MKINHLVKRYLLLFLILVLILGSIAWSLPIAQTSAQFSIPRPSTGNTPPAIAWPATGQASIGAKGYGILQSNGDQKAAPTASVAKVFTALAVLKQKPLKPGQQGPTITISQADMDSYESYFTQGGSLVKVSLGEQITERQALEAMLLPSANNMADTLARWAFGSVDNYLSYINGFNSRLGLTQTHVADASGFSEQTVSTADDLVKVGQLVVSDPVLSSIVAEEEATLPAAGVVHNTNWLLGYNGINGIKTGNTDQAGGCYLFSSDQQIGGRSVTLIGAVMAAPSLEQALASSRDLLASASSGFVDKPVLSQGQAVGDYSLPWGKHVPILTSQNVKTIYWYNKSYSQNYSAKDVGVVKKGAKIGTYYLNSGLSSSSSALVAGADSGHAPWRWRLYQRYL